MRSRRCSGYGWPSGDTRGSGRRVTCKAPLAHVEGGSGRCEASPTAILKDTHSVEGVFSELRLDGVPRSSAVRSPLCEALHRSRRCFRLSVDGSGNGTKRHQREGQGGPCRSLDTARRLLRRYGRRLGQVRLGGISAAGPYADQVHACRATASHILAAASMGYRARSPGSRRLGWPRVHRGARWLVLA